MGAPGRRHRDRDRRLRVAGLDEPLNNLSSNHAEQDRDREEQPFRLRPEGPAFSAWESPAPDPASREAACAILHEASHPAITIVAPRLLKPRSMPLVGSPGALLRR